MASVLRFLKKSSGAPPPSGLVFSKLATTLPVPSVRSGQPVLSAVSVAVFQPR